MSRRLPVYLVLDTSGSMTGEAIESVNYGISTLVQALRSDPYALETAFLSIITFDSNAQQVVPLTELTQFQLPTLTAQGTTAMGAALEVLAESIQRDVVKNTAERKGDWKPMVFLMTDGMPTDDIHRGLDSLRAAKPGVVVCCAAGMDADVDVLSHIAEHSTSSSNPDSKMVVRLYNADQASFKKLFQWISSSISQGSKRIDQGIQNGAPDLPPPPPEINIVM